MVWHVTPDMADEERFYSLFGQKATMRSVSTDHGTLSAYVNPSVAGELILAVNGRLIKGSAYYQVLRIIRQLWNGASLPVIVLSLLVDPSDIDANVHPQKMDIRFRSYGWLNQVVDELIKSLFSSDKTIDNGAVSFENQSLDLIDSRTVPVNDAHADYNLLFSMDFNGISTSAGKTFEIKDYLYDTFILVKRNGTYELWDQHAVNEKINYWRLSSLYGVQYLLEPLFSNVDGETAVALEQMGFDLQEVRGGYLIKAVPTLLLLSRSLDTIISDVQSVKGNIEKVRADLACRSSVKAGQKLTVMEMEALISEGLKVLDINYDPHGRPAIVSLDEQLIRRLFNR
jgi:DNA mismatch repair protein MutL